MPLSKIATIEEAEEMVHMLCEYLSSRAKKEEAAITIDDDIGLDGDTPSSRLSAEWSSKLMQSANRDDWGGCIFCRS
jgi:hypothetical protein